jgi:hypothetical protein
MKREKNYVIIKVKDGYSYDCLIQGFGRSVDHPGGLTAWSWVNHLRDKNWWGTAMEKEFFNLAREICEE